VTIVVKSRHMDATDALRQYAESKVAKLERLYDRIQSVEVILDVEGDRPKVEIVANATKKTVFVASAAGGNGDDMYAVVDDCCEKIFQQVRRHKDKVRDHQGPGHDREGLAGSPQ